jgi:hypothetical protein
MTATATTQHTDYAKMNFGGIFVPEFEMYMPMMMMATKSPAKSSSKVENNIFLSIIFSIKSSYFESLFVITNSISILCWQI